MAKILIFGSSGLIGSGLLTLAINNNAITSIVVVNRRANTLPSQAVLSAKVTEKIIDFESLEAHAALFATDHIFCCLGTTIKAAGNKQNFTQVDFELPLRIAKLAAANSVKSLQVISALGADPNSKIFYSRTKGQMEQAILAIKEDLEVTFLRPSLLIGPRKELRLGEKIGEHLFKFTSFAMRGPLKKYAPNHSSDVAMVMLDLAINKDLRKGPFVEANEITQLANDIANQ